MVQLSSFRDGSFNFQMVDGESSQMLLITPAFDVKIADEGPGLFRFQDRLLR